MKRALGIFFVAAGLAQAGPAFAGDAAIPPLLGTWSVDVSRLPNPPEARPKSVTIAFSDAGVRQWTTEVTIVHANGSTTHSKVTHPLDGTPTKVDGNYEVDKVSVMVPAPNVLIMVLSKDGVPGSTRIFTVAPDGNTETETLAYFKEDGTPAMRTNHFTRIR